MKTNKEIIRKFIIESNMIEGIIREPTRAEVAEYDRFINQKDIVVQDLVEFVSVYQPDAMLRTNPGSDVRVGNHTPPPGGSQIRYHLDNLMYTAPTMHPHALHTVYEDLHPFTDCNGRSGRMLWAWAMKNKGWSMSLGFLHTFYYQTLSEGRRSYG